MNKWIERQRHITDFTLSSLWRRKGKNAILIIVYTAVIFLLASVILFTHSLKKEAAYTLQDAPELIVQRMMGGRHDVIPVAYAEKIKKITGITTATPRLWGYYYDAIVGANYTVMVPADRRIAGGQVVVGAGVSRILQVWKGDSMEFRTSSGGLLSLILADTLATNSELVSADLVLMSEEDFRNLFGMPEGVATDIAVRVKNPKEQPMAAQKVARIFPETRQILKDEILRTYEAAFDWRSGMMIVILTASLMAFLILAWDKASGLGPEERKEIGILKAIGWETSDVLLMKFWEGIVISFSAFAVGILLAYAHVYFASAFVFESALKGWSVLYPQFTLTPDIDPFELTVVFFLTVVPYTVMTIVPAWRAATVDPDSMMR